MSPLKVAQSLGISRCTVYRLIKSGDLAATRVGGQWRVSQIDLESFLHLNRNTPIAA